MSRQDIREARNAAEETGQAGEELVNDHFAALRAAGQLSSVEWSSQLNAICPHDFEIVSSSGSRTLVEVKSTKGEFERPMHASLAELVEMSESKVDYRIYRVYGVSDGCGRLRVSAPMKKVADSILRAVSGLPTGVSIDGFSLDPTTLTFEPEVRLQAKFELTG